MTQLPNLGAHADGKHITGAQADKETTSNGLDDLLDDAMNTARSLSVTSGSPFTMTATEYTANYMHKLTGTPGAGITINVPATAKQFAINNTSDGDATIQVTGGGGANVVVTAGDLFDLYCDGTDVFALGGGAGGSGNTWLGFDFDAVPTADTVIRRIPIMESVVLPADLSGFYSLLGTAPAATYDIDVTYDTVSIATISITTGGVVSATTAGNTAKTLTATGILEFVAPSNGSETIDDMTFGVLATPA